MSFILDALKKSETDRQEQSGAEFAGVPTSPQTPSVPRWLWVVGLLLAVNLAVLVGLMFKPGTTPPESVSLPDPGATGSIVARDVAQPSFENQVAAARLRPPVQQEVLTSADPVANATDTVQPLLVSQDPSSIRSVNIYPTFHEVVARGSIKLPELHIDIHVYSTEPEERFVFINMSKLREGSTLDEGPVVVEITVDGVVLGHQGHLFLLPRE